MKVELKRRSPVERNAYLENKLAELLLKQRNLEESLEACRQMLYTIIGLDQLIDCHQIAREALDMIGHKMAP